MNLDKKFIGLDSEQIEVNSIYSKLIQVQNLDSSMIQVSKGCYILGRSFALVDPNDEMVKNLLDKKVIREIPVTVVSNKKLKQEYEKLQSRKSTEKQEVKEIDNKIESLSKLFTADNGNIRQNS